MGEGRIKEILFEEVQDGFNILLVIFFEIFSEDFANKGIHL